MRSITDFLPWAEAMYKFTAPRIIDLPASHGCLHIARNSLSIMGDRGHYYIAIRLNKQIGVDALHDCLTRYDDGMDNFHLFCPTEYIEFTHRYTYTDLYQLSRIKCSIPYPCTEEMYFQLSTAQDMHHQNCPVEYNEYSVFEEFCKSIPEHNRVVFSRVGELMSISNMKYEAITQALRNYVNENS